MTYCLKNYDEVLVEFRIGVLELEQRVTEILYVANHAKAIFPPGFDMTPDGLTKWLRRRSIPKNRAYVHEIFASYRILNNDLNAILQVCKALSVNDSYWVVPTDFSGLYKDFNLYENSFSEVLALVAYTGYATTIKELSTSPEFTTAGMLPKAWRRLKNKIYLYKGGTKGYANAGKEPYSEYYAAQIAAKMGIHHVAYGLEKWKGILASTCELFTDINTAYVPIGTLVTAGGIDAVTKFYRELGKEFFEEFASMLVFDAVIYNEDRHYGNFGLLRDCHSGTYVGCAPSFDHGYSLFAMGLDLDLEDIEKYASQHQIASCGLTHDEIARNFCGEIQRKQLRNLINFNFVRHPCYNLPEERLVILERFVKSRVEQILAMPKRKLQSKDSPSLKGRSF